MILTTDWKRYEFEAVSVSSGSFKFTTARDSTTEGNIWIDDVTITATEINSAPGIAAGQPGDGDPVASWSDTSGQNITGTQSEVFRRPTCRKNVADGKDGVHFDNLDDQMSFTLNRTIGERVIYAIVLLGDKRVGGNARWIGFRSPQGHPWTHALERWTSGPSTGNGGVTRSLVHNANPPPDVIGAPEIDFLRYKQPTLAKSYCCPSLDPYRFRVVHRFHNTETQTTTPAPHVSILDANRITLGDQLRQELTVMELVVFGRKLTHAQERELLQSWKDEYPSAGIEVEL